MGKSHPVMTLSIVGVLRFYLRAHYSQTVFVQSSLFKGLLTNRACARSRNYTYEHRGLNATCIKDSRFPSRKRQGISSMI